MAKTIISYNIKNNNRGMWSVVYGRHQTNKIFTWCFGNNNAFINEIKAKRTGKVVPLHNKQALLYLQLSLTIVLVGGTYAHNNSCIIYPNSTICNTNCSYILACTRYCYHFNGRTIVRGQCCDTTNSWIWGDN